MLYEVITYTKGFQNTGMFNKKYMGTNEFKHTGAGDWKHNWAKNYIDIRFADVLLMAAEMNLTNDATKALGYLNEVRTRALGDDAALDAIVITSYSIHYTKLYDSPTGKLKAPFWNRGPRAHGTFGSMV